MIYLHAHHTVVQSVLLREREHPFLSTLVHEFRVLTTSTITTTHDNFFGGGAACSTRRTHSHGQALGVVVDRVVHGHAPHHVGLVREGSPVLLPLQLSRAVGGPGAGRAGCGRAQAHPEGLLRGLCAQCKELEDNK